MKQGVECFVLGGKRQKGEKVADEEGEGGLLAKEKKADGTEVRVQEGRESEEEEKKGKEEGSSRVRRSSRVSKTESKRNSKSRM